MGAISILTYVHMPGVIIILYGPAWRSGLVTGLGKSNFSAFYNAVHIMWGSHHRCPGLPGLYTFCTHYKGPPTIPGVFEVCFYLSVTLVKEIEFPALSSHFCTWTVPIIRGSYQSCPEFPGLYNFFSHYEGLPPSLRHVPWSALRSL